VDVPASAKPEAVSRPDPLADERPLDGFFLRLSAFGIGALTRVLDVALLLWRPSLWRAYARIWAGTFRQSPFPPKTFEKVHVARRAGRGLRELVYGETPVWTAVRLLRAAGVDEHSVVVDLGAGRGRALLGARYLGARARGVELVPSHAERANAALVGTGVEVVEGEAEAAHLEDATHVYVTWTCLAPESRAALTARLRELAADSRVLTLSVPIEDPAFAVEERLVGLYSWGFDAVYLHRRLGRDRETG
jgi:SAM-dependent methyltransferase